MFKKAKSVNQVEDYSLEGYTGDIRTYEYTRFLTHLLYNNLHAANRKCTRMERG